MWGQIFAGFEKYKIKGCHKICDISSVCLYNVKSEGSVIGKTIWILQKINVHFDGLSPKPISAVKTDTQSSLNT